MKAMKQTIHANSNSTDDKIVVTVIELPSGDRMAVELSTVKALRLVAELVDATNRVLENQEV
jgi:hypothetical protein